MIKVEIKIQLDIDEKHEGIDSVCDLEHAIDIDGRKKIMDGDYKYKIIK